MSDWLAVGKMLLHWANAHWSGRETVVEKVIEKVIEKVNWQARILDSCDKNY